MLYYIIEYVRVIFWAPLFSIWKEEKREKREKRNKCTANHELKEAGPRTKKVKEKKEETGVPPTTNTKRRGPARGGALFSLLGAGFAAAHVALPRALGAGEDCVAAGDFSLSNGSSTSDRSE